MTDSLHDRPPNEGIEALTWELASSRDELLEQSRESRLHEVSRPSGEPLAIFGSLPTRAESDPEAELERLGDLLASLVQIPELNGLHEIHIVDSLGSFLDASGAPARPIRALPPDSEGRMLVSRAALESIDDLDALFAELADRELRAQSGFELQKRERTAMAQESLPAEALLEPEEGEDGHGNYQGRPIIGRDSAISGGVYLSGAGSRPAIVVDHDRDHRLNRLYRKLLEALAPNQRLAAWRSLSGRLVGKRRAGRALNRRVLSEVHGWVKQALPHWSSDEHDGKNVDDAVVEAIGLRGEKVRPGQKIYLGEYLRISGEDRGGECVHQALLAGHLLERLREDGLIRGEISFERNELAGLGPHAWIRFRDDAGEAWVLDPAQDYFGPVDGDSRWMYMREEDLEQLRQRPL